MSLLVEKVICALGGTKYAWLEYIYTILGCMLKFSENNLTYKEDDAQVSIIIFKIKNIIRGYFTVQKIRFITLRHSSTSNY